MRCIIALLVPLALLAGPLSAEAQRGGRGPRIITINPDSVRAVEAGLEWRKGKAVDPKARAASRAPARRTRPSTTTARRAGATARRGTSTVESPPAPISAKVGIAPPPAKRP